MSSRRARIERTAREVLGFAALRPGQREAVESVLAGRDTLAVLSTGSGKSAIYQIAGLLTKGPTLVVSPLIALQRDQVDGLRRRALGAAQLNSSVPEREREEALAELAEDALEFLFLAPEQLANAAVLDELAAARPTLLVVDEAHCISEWGHDFRPDYLRLGAAIETFGHPRVLALTATAAPPVRAEIVERLGLRDPDIVVRGFDRPNLELDVARFHEARHKDEALLEAVAEADRPGIVYAATRKRTEALAAALRDRGVEAVAYHAGLKAAAREAVQERFMASDADVIVATTAFGMGVDKPDVRFVFHAEVPESVDAYWQEVGRAGRDGEPAHAVLFYRAEDLGLRRFFAGSGHVGADELTEVAEVVGAAGEPVAPTELQVRTELSQSKLATAVSRLEDAGAVEVLATGEVAARPAVTRPERQLSQRPHGTRSYGSPKYDRTNSRRQPSISSAYARIMSSRERSSSRRSSSSCSAARTASSSGGASRSAATAPVGSTSTAPASSSRDTAVASFDCDSSVRSCSSVGSTGSPAAPTTSATSVSSSAPTCPLPAKNRRSPRSSAR